MAIDLERRVMKVVVDQGELNASPPPGAHLVDDLGFDSLGLVELTLALEREFDVQISDADAMALRSVRDIVAYLERPAR